MKITRALLLSSRKQAVSYEPSGGLFVPSPYCYRVKDLGDDGIRFQIFRMVSEDYVDDRNQQRTRRVTVDTQHVGEVFKDAGELINFLRRHEIDFESNWQPVESE